MELDRQQPQSVPDAQSPMIPGPVHRFLRPVTNATASPAKKALSLDHQRMVAGPALNNGPRVECRRKHARRPGCLNLGTALPCTSPWAPPRQPKSPPRRSPLGLWPVCWPRQTAEHGTVGGKAFGGIQVPEINRLPRPFIGKLQGPGESTKWPPPRNPIPPIHTPSVREILVSLLCTAERPRPPPAEIVGTG